MAELERRLFYYSEWSKERAEVDEQECTFALTIPLSNFKAPVGHIGEESSRSSGKLGLKDVGHSFNVSITFAEIGPCKFLGFRVASAITSDENKKLIEELLSVEDYLDEYCIFEILDKTNLNKPNYLITEYLFCDVEPLF